MMGRTWLVVLAEAEGLRWVLRERRMAWSAASAKRASQIRPGDRLVLYVARGAFHNPTRDESRLLGLATVTSPVEPLPRPLELAGRTFVVGCSLDLEVVLPERGGVPVHPLVPRLSFIKRKEAWGQSLRSGLVPLPERDAAILTRAIRQAAARAPRSSSRAGPAPPVSVPDPRRPRQRRRRHSPALYEWPRP